MGGEGEGGSSARRENAQVRLGERAYPFGKKPDDDQSAGRLKKNARRRGRRRFNVLVRGHGKES